MYIKFWNHKVSGIFSAIILILIATISSLRNRLNTMIHRYNFRQFDKGSVIQQKVIFRYPGNITIGKNVIISKHSVFESELSDGTLTIGDNTHIGKGVAVDFSGNVSIGNNCTLSENVNILSHDHGMNPRSNPEPKSLKIGNNVWIGAHAIILQNVREIENNSIIAAGSVVTTKVISNVVVAGNPAKIIKSL